jgi:hypothetical protein
LVVVGIAACVWTRRTLPLTLFAAANVAQIAVLWGLAGRGLASTYITNKMFHLLLYPMALFAGLALAALTALLKHWWPTSGRNWRVLVLLCPLAIMVLALRRDLPLHPYSAVSEPVYDVGQWAKLHLPSGCVDYLVDHWMTAYWLHVHILGNPRDSARTQAIVDDFVTRRNTPSFWDNPDHLPFAIVGNLDDVPSDVRGSFTVLYRSDPAAVVQRANAPPCQNNDPPLDRVTLTPRQHTLASLFNQTPGLP